MRVLNTQAQQLLLAKLVVVLVPDCSSTDALVRLVQTQDLHAGPNSAMLAFWCTKADREQTVDPGQNIYSKEAPLAESTFGSWVDVVDQMLTPGTDVAVICEGREWSNKHIIINKLATTKWMVRPIVLDYVDEDWRNLYASGATMSSDGVRKAIRVPRGFGKAGLTETL